MGKQLLNFGFRIIVSLSILALLISRINVNGIVTHLKTIDPNFLILAIVFFILYICTWALRWHVFIRDTQVPISYLETIRTLLIGFALSLFLPSSVGADVGRTLDLARTKVQKVAILSTVLMDRMVGLIAVVGCAVVALAVAGHRYVTLDILVVIIATAFVLGASWRFFFHVPFMNRFKGLLEIHSITRRFSRKIRDIYKTLYFMQKKRKLFITAIVISVITSLFEILSVLMLSYAIGDRFNSVYFFIFMPIIWVILVIPISIGGLGLREAVFVFFFTQIGMTSEHAITVSLLYYALYTVTGIIGGTIPIVHQIYTRIVKMMTSKSDLPAVSENV